MVELLVVIAIIGILISLLLPAVQAAREAARASKCQNNLKQIGLAMHNYHNQAKCFPPGNIVTDMRPSMWGWTIPCRTNWAISLLPYLEQEPLYAGYNHDVSNMAPENQSVRGTDVPAYNCPSDIRAGDLETPMYGLGPTSPVKYDCSSYRAMAGRSDTMYIMMSGQGFWGYLGFQPIHADHPDWKGVFHMIGPSILTSCESFSSIKDGTSNTIAVGERHGAKDDIKFGGTYWAYSTVYSTSQAIPLSRSLRSIPDFWECVRFVPSGKVCDFGWGAYHPGRINFLFCDGSVRSVSTTINMELFCRLAAVSDNQVAQAP